MNQTIAVFFGGRSPEHDVSIITGQLILSELSKLGYNVVPVYLDKQGSWFIEGGLDKLKVFKDFKPENYRAANQYFLDLEKSKGKMVFRKKGLAGREIQIDLAFPAFHGTNGEDGTIQGLFEILNIPYVGCDVTSSAVTMDKILTKQLYVSQNIPTTKFVFYNNEDWDKQKSEILKNIETQIRFPAFVKPARLGSSIGIAKVKDASSLERAVEVALHYDVRFLVETAVEELMDITCAVLGNDELTASELQESVFSDELFSYQEKYLNDGGAQLGNAQKNLIIPATLDSKIAEGIKDTAKQIFKLFGCSGIARVDFLYDRKRGKFYANEVNTLPGTLYHHLWKASGMPLPDLLTRLLSLSRSRHEAKGRITYTFESEILNQANAIKLNLNKDG